MPKIDTLYTPRKQPAPYGPFETPSPQRRSTRATTFSPASSSSAVSVLSSPSVLTMYKAQRKQFSPKVYEEDTSDNVISYDTLKEYMEENGYENYESPIKILDDVELWKASQNENPEVLIISDANALIVRGKDKEVIVYTPSKVFEAFMLSSASCMIFLRDDHTLRYKGTFKASPLQTIYQARYQAFSEADKKKIVEMSMRLHSKQWAWQTEQALREGEQVLNGYRLDYVGWEADMQEDLDVLDRKYRRFYLSPKITYRRTYLKSKGEPTVDSDGDTTDEDMLPVCQMPESPTKHVATAKAAKEKAAREKAAREKAAKEKAAKKQAAKERTAKEKAEAERMEKEKAKRERAERDRAERERVEQGRGEREKAEKERAERDKVEKEKAEWAEMDWEAASDRAEREKTEDPDEEMVAWVRNKPRTLMSQVLDR